MLTPKTPKIRGFPKIVVPQNGWFIMENPIKMDDLGVPLFSETSIYISSRCFGVGLPLKIPKTQPIFEHNGDYKNLAGCHTNSPRFAMMMLYLASGEHSYSR